MSTLLVLGIVAIVVLATVGVAVTARSRQDSLATGQLSRETLHRDADRRKLVAVGGRETGRDVELAPAPAPAPSSTLPTVWVRPDPAVLDVTRRQFLNRSVVAMMGLGIFSFTAAAFTAFLWPPPSVGFGGKINLGKIDDLLASIKANNGFLYVPDGRMWVTAYPPEALPKAEIVYKAEACLPGMEAGVNCLYQKCVHLGCRVPACLTSQWFECPCHGSQYNRVGEKRGGPAPRGLDRFPVTVGADGTITADTASATIILGPPIGTNTTGQEAQGPHCV